MQLLTSTLATSAVLAGSALAANFTGDVLNGVPVIRDLNLADVPAQTVSRYYLRVGELNGGHPVHIPVMVARGTPESLETGKKLSLSAAIHGDELNLLLSHWPPNCQPHGNKRKPRLPGYRSDRRW